MDHLAILRHGDYDMSDPMWGLNEEGQRQIANAAPILQEIVGGGRAVVLASPTARTTQSADILAERLGGIEVRFHPLLESSGGYLSERQMLEAIELIREVADDADVVILVTHFEYGKFFPAFYGCTELGVSDWPIREVAKGGMVIIACEKKQLRRF